jgi:hypothetical protein
MAVRKGYSIFTRHRSVLDYARLAAIPVLVSAAYEGLAIIPRTWGRGPGAELQAWTVGCLLIVGLSGVIGWWMAIRWRGAAFDDFLAGAVFGLGSGLISALVGNALTWWAGAAPLNPADLLLDLATRPLFTALWAGVVALTVALASKFIEVW